MGRPRNSSSSSSTDSNSHPCISCTTSLSQPNRDLRTDLRLGLSISAASQEKDSYSRDQCLNWPPVKQLLRNRLANKGCSRNPTKTTFFVKVYMEGIPIGRKLDLFAHKGYDGLIRTLRHMFGTTILSPDKVTSNRIHVLTYEDKEGDWMMVGDVPWEMFLTTVKRLKIARADKC